MENETDSETFLALSYGDQVEAMDSQGIRLQGTVEYTAPGQGAVWIYTRHGERKLLNADEHRIARLPADQQGTPRLSGEGIKHRGLTWLLKGGSAAPGSRFPITGAISRQAPQEKA